MLFSSVTFLCYFLPLFLLAYLLLPGKNLVLFLFSLLFYCWGEGYFAAILLASITVNFFIGRFMASADERLRSRALAAGIAFNIATLAYFKYFGFVSNGVLGMGLPPSIIPHLPLGISFFTFQAMSYLIDTYRRKAPPADSWLDLATYISMFPQLVAGPIVRYDTVAARLRERFVRGAHVYRGLLFLSVGLAQKIIVADTVGLAADGIFSLGSGQISPLLAWTGTACYTLQIYFDFGGYSNMAIGLGFMLGFEFPQNFNYPYISRSVTEFWRRWHISLSTWFRDYLYIPLGGNRQGRGRTLVNLLTVFLLCGLWHGAEWTFVVWGAYHGFFLVLERVGLKKALDSLPGPLSWLYTMLIVMVGWIIFRAETFGQAYLFMKAFFGFSSVTVGAPGVWEFLNYHTLAITLVGVTASTPLAKNFFGRPMAPPAVEGIRPALFSLRFWIGLAFSLGLGGITFMYLVSSTYNPFIYFRF